MPAFVHYMWLLFLWWRGCILSQKSVNNIGVGSCTFPSPFNSPHSLFLLPPTFSPGWIRDMHAQIINSIKDLQLDGEDPRKLLQSWGRLRFPRHVLQWVWPLTPLWLEMDGSTLLTLHALTSSVGIEANAWGSLLSLVMKRSLLPNFPKYAPLLTGSACDLLFNPNRP